MFNTNQKNNMENQNSNQVKGFTFIFFNSWNNENTFYYDIYENQWVMDTKTDFTQDWKFSVPDDCKLQYMNYAKRLFNFEDCKCDGNGIQFGFYQEISE
jgi:hypothetical protein